MFEELYEPLSKIDEYLDRIGVKERKPLTAEYLDELIYAHQCTVPFDNLDVCEGNAIPSLGIADLFDKIVVRKRGGYCFELNALFAALLRALGFQVRPCMARVLLRPGANPLLSHRANIVTIGQNRYLADVGFGGPQPTFAPLMEDGSVRTEHGQTFYMHERDDSWWEVGYAGSKEEERIVLQVCALPVGEHDFVPLSFYQSQYPESVFRLNRMVNIRTADGSRNLRNNTYTVYCNGAKTETEIEDEAEIDKLLLDVYGIVRERG